MIRLGPILLGLLFVTAMSCSAQNEQSSLNGLLKQGDRYFDLQEYPAALKAYQQAYRLSNETSFEADVARMKVWATSNYAYEKLVEEAVAYAWPVATHRQVTALMVVLTTLYSNTLDLNEAEFWLAKLKKRDDPRFQKSEKKLAEKIDREKQAYDAVMQASDFGFLKDPASHYSYEFQFFVRSLLSRGTYSLPVFQVSTVDALLDSVSTVDRWQVVGSRFVVIEGYISEAGGVRGLLLFDLKKRKGIFALWEFPREMYLFGNDKSMLASAESKAIFDRWKSQVIKAWQHVYVNIGDYETYDFIGV